MKKREVSLELPETLGDFTSKDNWDKFFSLRGAGDSFEWYAEWHSLRDTLISQLSSVQFAASSDDAAPLPPQILVPECGRSRMSEYIYDAGFRQITCIDFSKIVISDMLRRNIRSRPEMRWLVMDMTNMQLANETFDFVLDKGGLDTLMEGSELGINYLKEVKRVLKIGGRFLCLTLAESHVLGLLFNLFRFGWKCSIHAVPHKNGKKPTIQTFMVVFLKEQLDMVNLIEFSFDQSAMASNIKQAQALIDAIKSENQTREEYSSSTDVIYSLRDLELGAQGNLQVLQAGRRFLLSLGGQGDSLYSYRTVLLDAQQKVGPFLYNCGVFFVPQARAREWQFSSEEGQWLIVESSKAARLIMVFLDSSHSHFKMEAIQKDLSPLVKSLAPLKDYGEYQIPFMMESDGVKQKKIVHQATSKITGPMIVEDVIFLLIVDADSSDLSSGLACPPSDFVEESFLSSVKDFLSARGLFAINLVSRSSAVRQMVVTRLKAAFNHLFSLELEEDVNVVLFASTMDTCFQEDHLDKAVNQLQNLLKVPMPSLQSQVKTIKRLK